MAFGGRAEGRGDGCSRRWAPCCDEKESDQSTGDPSQKPAAHHRLSNAFLRRRSCKYDDQNQAKIPGLGESVSLLERTQSAKAAQCEEKSLLTTTMSLLRGMLQAGCG